MIRPPGECSRAECSRRGKAAYSLIELLTVMSALAIAMGLVTVSMGSLRSSSMSTATRQFADFLNLCRSQAIARHTVIRVGIVTDSSDSDREFRRFSAWSWNKRTREFEQVHEWRQLGADLSFAASLPEAVKESGYALRDASSIRGDYWLRRGDQFRLSENEVVRFIEFSPAGRASIPDGDRKNLTIVLQDGNAGPSKDLTNWSQFNIDTLTGRVRIHRP